MNKRQKKKRYKKMIEEEWAVCQECGKTLDPENEYHKRFYLCDSICGLHLVGMSWSDFY